MSEQFEKAKAAFSQVWNGAAYQGMLDDALRAALAAAQAGGYDGGSANPNDAAVHGRYWHEQGFVAGIEAAAQGEEKYNWRGGGLEAGARIRALRPPAAPAGAPREE